MGEVIRILGLVCYQHAVDTQLQLTLSADPRKAVETMNRYQEQVIFQWM